ncbi:hypothetical protein D9611_008581 [Ephemerocybe angulata]|uniref:Uncharacterized protein n=1 Tax=Ephemerocybe angulata TaxID=980116 RepID=A0A8H5AZX7_9AGAR|nr:hypothetical protein D9611_008581 [Tulosesus angulatus]
MVRNLKRSAPEADSGDARRKRARVNVDGRRSDRERRKERELVDLPEMSPSPIPSRAPSSHSPVVADVRRQASNSFTRTEGQAAKVKARRHRRSHRQRSHEVEEGGDEEEGTPIPTFRYAVRDNNEDEEWNSLPRRKTQRAISVDRIGSEEAESRRAARSSKGNYNARRDGKTSNHHLSLVVEKGDSNDTRGEKAEDSGRGEEEEKREGEETEIYEDEAEGVEEEQYYWDGDGEGTDDEEILTDDDVGIVLSPRTLQRAENQMIDEAFEYLEEHYGEDFTESDWEREEQRNEEIDMRLQALENGEWDEFAFRD